MQSAWQPLARGARACMLLGAALLPACFHDNGFTDDPASSTSSSSSSAASTSGAATTTTTDETLTPLETGATEVDATGTSTATTVLPDETTTGACTPQTWYLDADSDGYGVADQTVMACEPPPGYVGMPGDCAPMDPTIAPGVLELCDMQDNDCDLGVDEYSPMNPACSGCRVVLGEQRVYYLCSTSLDWPAARLACQAYGAGADLVVLHSQAEQDLLVTQISSVPSEAAGEWWIGLSDLAVEGTFAWVDATPLDFAAWLPGEPNQFMGLEEDCAQFSVGMPGLWNDLVCTALGFYICEGPQ